MHPLLDDADDSVLDTRSVVITTKREHDAAWDEDSIDEYTRLTPPLSQDGSPHPSVRHAASSPYPSPHPSSGVHLSLCSSLCMVGLVASLTLLVFLLLLLPIQLDTPHTSSNTLLFLSLQRWLPFLLPSLSPSSPASLLNSSSPLNSSLTPSPPTGPPVPINLHRLARLAHRLHLGLPVLVTGIGGSNMQGDGIRDPNGPGDVLRIIVSWMNEKFPVNGNVTAADVVGQAFLKQPEVAGECPRLLDLATRHVGDNRGVGGTRSDMAGFCLQRLVPCAKQRSPDLLLIDYAINDSIHGDDTVSGTHGAAMERLIRQILLALPNTAILLTNFPADLTMNNQNAELHYHPPAQLYHVPEISLRRWCEKFLLQPGYQRQHPWAAQFDLARRLLPSTVPLPLPEYVHAKSGGAMDYNAAFWKDEFHLNDAGHQLLASLANQEILRFVDNLRNSQWTSVTDPIFDDYAREVAPLVPFLDRPLEPLPAPLDPILFALDSQLYQCFVLYWPYQPRAQEMDQAQAEAFLQVQRNDGWLYAQSRHAHNKFAMVVDADHSTTLGQRISIALPATNTHSLVVAHLRTWNASMLGDAAAWLSCELSGGNEGAAGSSPTSTPRVTLSGVWPETSTQAGSTQIWPIAAAASNGSTALPQFVQGPACDLRFLHIEHTTVGEFRFIGYMIQ